MASVGSGYTSPKEVESKLETLRATFASGCTKDLRWRKWQLKQLFWLVRDNEAAISDALYKDIGKHEFEAFFTEVASVKRDILDHLNNLEDWAADEVPDAGFAFTKLGSSVTKKEPLGVALIIGPWNFPFALVMQPLCAAIAAGCTAMVKSSELCPTVASLVETLLPQYLESSAYTTVTGGAEEMSFILSLKYNHIFFTGSTPVGKHIAAAAAKHLTPTVLELGGQGPTIVTATANVDLAAKCIACSKFLNAGQICITTNHVFVDPSIHKEFVARLKIWNETFHGNSKEGSHMAKIVNERNHDRLTNMITNTTGEVICRSTGGREKLTIPTTIIDNVTMDDALLDSEIFGPLLPIIVMEFREAVEKITAGPHPLAINIFSHEQSEIDYILDHTISGGVSINDCMLHAAVPNAGFGGVGDSGMGAYHGKLGFEAFTHRRTVARMPDFLDSAMSFRYPPFDMKNKKAVDVGTRVGFKRDETLQDQKIGGGYGKVSVLGVTIALALVATLHAPSRKVLYARLGNILGS
ncbi:aldehyde dehydrogenase, partial [Aureobasidium melanogenum]